METQMLLFHFLIIMLGMTGMTDKASTKTEIERLIKASGAEVVGVSLYDTQTSWTLELNENVSMHAASTMKVPVMMEIFKQVAKRFPQGVYGNLAQARIKSAAGDFAGAANDAKQAQAAAPTDAQKQSIQALINRLDAKQDINK